MGAQKISNVCELVKSTTKKSKWRKIDAPRTWNPTQVGEELIGNYGGRTMRSGAFGQYEVVLIHTDDRAFMVSGVRIIQLIDAAILESFETIRIVFQGWQAIAGGEKKMRLFDLYVKGART